MPAPFKWTQAPKALNADAMRAPIKRPWCRDEKPMTPERILHIARSQGEFTVHRYLFRAQPLRRACQRMVETGLLRRAGQRGDFLAFKIAPPPLPPISPDPTTRRTT